MATNGRGCRQPADVLRHTGPPGRPIVGTAKNREKKESMLATFAAYLVGITFEDYFVRRYGLTKDLERVRLYYQVLKDTKPPGSLDDIKKLSKILKFDWIRYYDKPIKMKFRGKKLKETC